MIRAIIVAALLLVPLVAPLPASAGPGDSCGGVAPACEAGMFCDPEPSVCRPEVGGTCTALPTLCSRLPQPVCGCDGKTYLNDCERQRAGVARQSDGSCG